MAFLGRPLGYSIFYLMASTRDPIYQYFSQGFRGQPSFVECIQGLLRNVAYRHEGFRVGCHKAAGRRWVSGWGRPN